MFPFQNARRIEDPEMRRGTAIFIGENGYVMAVVQKGLDASGLEPSKPAMEKSNERRHRYSENLSRSIIHFDPSWLATRRRGGAFQTKDATCSMKFWLKTAGSRRRRMMAR